MLNQVFNGIFAKPSKKQHLFVEIISVLCLSSLILFTISAPFLKPAAPQMFPEVLISNPTPPKDYPATLKLQIDPDFQNDIPAKDGHIGVNIILDTGGEETIGADAVINFDHSFLELINYSTDKDITYENFIFNDEKKEEGKIKISAYSLSAVEPFSDKIFASLFFNTKGIAEQADINFTFTLGETNDSNVSAFSAGPVKEDQEQDLLGSVQNLTINIVPPLPSPIPSLSPSPSPIPIPSPSPTPFPSPSSPPLACHYNADLNNDGKINSADLSILILQWGKQSPLGCLITNEGKKLPNPDLNGDGTVNSTDIQIFVPWYNP